MSLWLALAKMLNSGEIEPLKVFYYIPHMIILFTIGKCLSREMEDYLDVAIQCFPEECAKWYAFSAYRKIYEWQLSYFNLLISLTTD